MTAPCPACGGPADPAHRPFCSQGCRDRDLLRWLDEGYRLPGPAADDDRPEPDGRGVARRGLERPGLDRAGRPD